MLSLLGLIFLDPRLLGILLSRQQRLKFLNFVVELLPLDFCRFFETTLLNLKLVNSYLFFFELVFGSLARPLVLLNLLVVGL